MIDDGHQGGSGVLPMLLQDGLDLLHAGNARVCGLPQQGAGHGQSALLLHQALQSVDVCQRGNRPAVGTAHKVELELQGGVGGGV